MKPYLVRGDGDRAGIAIERLAGVSSDDRWLVIVRDSALILIDDTTGIERVLPDADLIGDVNGWRSVAAFDMHDEHLVYARLVGDSSRIAIHALATHSEREVPSSGGTLFQVQPEPGGPWIHLTYLPEPRPPRLPPPPAWLQDFNGPAPPPRAPPGAEPRLDRNAPPGLDCDALDAHLWRQRRTPMVSTWLRPDTGEIRTVRPMTQISAVSNSDVLASFSTSVLYRVNETVQMIDTKTREAITLPHVDGDELQQARSIVALDRMIIDLETLRVLGEVTRRPLAVDAAGRALVPLRSWLAGPEGHPSRVHLGPLHWELPRPIASNQAPASTFTLFPPPDRPTR